MKHKRNNGDLLYYMGGLVTCVTLSLCAIVHFVRFDINVVL